MIKITKYISEDGIEWTAQADAEFRDVLLKIAARLEQVYDIDHDWLQVAETIYEFIK